MMIVISITVNDMMNRSWSINLFSCHSCWNLVVPAIWYFVVLFSCFLRPRGQTWIWNHLHTSDSECPHRCRIGIDHRSSSDLGHHFLGVPTVGMTWKTNTFTGDALFCDVNMMSLAGIWFGFKWIGDTHKWMTFQIYTWNIHISCFEFKVKHSQSYLCMSYCPNSCLHRQI